MEETLKVGIGGVSFVINKEAYVKLNAYLSSLSLYYAQRAEGKEIMEDIESRIAELLLDQYTQSDVVTLRRVNDVIAIMGNPSQINDGNPEQSANAATSDAESNSKDNFFKKRLYRDTSSRVIGGVLSGFGNYFKIDASLLRILAAGLLALAIFGNFPNRSATAWLIVAYVICWISMPKAKTVVQQFASKGQDPGLKGIENEFNNPGRHRGSAAGRVLSKIIMVIISLLLICLGISGIISGWGLVYGIYVCLGVTPLSMMHFFALPGVYFWIIAFCGIALWLIPCLLLLYWGFLCIPGIKRPKHRYSLFAFLTWLITLLILVVASLAAISKVNFDVNSNTNTTFTPVHTVRDTLYVTYAPLPQYIGEEKLRGDWVDVQHDKVRSEGKTVSYNASRRPVRHFNMGFWKSRLRGGKRAYAVYPVLTVQTIADSSAVDATLIKKTTRLYTPNLGKKQAKISEEDVENAAEELITVTDSLVVVHPQIITHKQKFLGTTASAKIKVPKRCVVIIQGYQ